MSHIKKSLNYFDAKGKRVTPADPQLVIQDQESKNQAMLDVKKRLKREEAIRANILHKMSEVTRRHAGREIKLERKLEKLQKQLVDQTED